MGVSRRYWSPYFEIGPSFCLPPVNFAAAHRSRPQNPRPSEKTLGSGTTAAIVVAPITPNAGDGLEPLTCFVRAMLTTIRFSSDPIIVCTA